MWKDYIKKGMSNLAKKNVNRKLAESRAGKNKQTQRDEGVNSGSRAKNKFSHKK